MRSLLRIALFVLVSILHLQVKANDISDVHQIIYVLHEDQASLEKLIVYPLGQTYRTLRMIDYKSENRLPEFLDEKDFASRMDLNLFLNKFPKHFIESAQALDIEPQFKTEVVKKMRPQDNTVIWPTQNNWSMDWEKQYSEWVASDVDEMFFIEHGIATDCADVAVSLRWIFSRIHGLPAAFRLAGSNSLFTNESMRSSWLTLKTADSWDKDELFRASLDYVNGMTYTHSLIKDSYPVQISIEYFMAGVHHLNMHSDDTGHTMFVNRIGLEFGGVNLIYSNVPKEVREMYVTGFFDYDQYNNFAEGGFLKIRWPVRVNDKWTLLPATQMPGYSLEQYDPNFMGEQEYYYLAVYQHLGLDVNPMLQFEKLAATVLALVEDRIVVVQEGYSFCRANDCSPGTINYENWSTPSRDKRIRNIFDSIDNLSFNSDEVFWAWEDMKKNKSYAISNKSVKLSKIVQNFQWGDYSSDPRHSIFKRWGL